MDLWNELSNRSFFWLYAANYSGWWLYNRSQMRKIDLIYRDYTAKNGISTPKSPGSPSSHDPIDDNDKIFDHVEFDDDNYNDGEIFDYNINVGDDEYRVDIKRMKQINIKSPDKQRSIGHISINNNLIKDLKLKKLKEYGVKGISGKLW